MSRKVASASELQEGLLWANTSFERLLRADLKRSIADGEEHGCLLSIIVMARDEERVIERVLSSIPKRHVQRKLVEVLLLDTGSVDATVERAKMACESLRVEHFSWTESFAEARNYGLTKARGEFVFFVDADETLHPDTVDKVVRRLILMRGPTFPLFAICPLIINSNQEIVRGVARIFPRRKGISYMGRVHERLVVAPDQEPLAMGTYNDIILYHDGYEQQVVIEKRKVERNIALIEKMFDDGDADDPWITYYYCRDGEDCLERDVRERKLLNLLSSVENDDVLRKKAIELLLDLKLKVPDLEGVSVLIDDLVLLVGDEHSDVLYYRSLYHYLLRQQEAFSNLMQLSAYRLSKGEVEYDAINAKYKHIEHMIALLKLETGDVVAGEALLDKLLAEGYLVHSMAMPVMN